MGAEEFFVRKKGETAREAFNKAVSEAKLIYGNNGKSGTIAEKNSFKIIDVPKDKKPTEYALELIKNYNHWVNDKWGAAGCIDLGNNEYLFFGIAST